MIGLGIVVFVGLYNAFMAYRQSRAAGQMMGGMMGGMIIGPFWYFIGTIIVVVGIGGLYLMIREDLTKTPETEQKPSPEYTDSENTGSSDETEPPRSTRTDILPEDERRILEPVIESPGITQVALRDRSQFSKAKVSQTVSELEKRGVIYREQQGRTYRIYPDDSLQDDLRTSGARDDKIDR